MFSTLIILDLGFKNLISNSARLLGEYQTFERMSDEEVFAYSQLEKDGFRDCEF